VRHFGGAIFRGRLRERGEFLRLGHLPFEIADQVDALSNERREMHRKFGPNRQSCASPFTDGSAEFDRVHWMMTAVCRQVEASHAAMLFSIDRLAILGRRSFG